jgi:hypothetical protein
MAIIENGASPSTFYSLKGIDLFVLRGRICLARKRFIVVLTNFLFLQEIENFLIVIKSVEIWTILMKTVFLIEIFRKI